MLEFHQQQDEINKKKEKSDDSWTAEQSSEDWDDLNRWRKSTLPWKTAWNDQFLITAHEFNLQTPTNVQRSHTQQDQRTSRQEPRDS